MSARDLDIEKTVEKMSSILLIGRSISDLKIEFIGPHVDNYNFYYADRAGGSHSCDRYGFISVRLSYWDEEESKSEAIFFKTIQTFQNHYDRKRKALGLPANLFPRLDEW